MRFIDFGAARTFNRDEIAGEVAKNAFEQDSIWLVCLAPDTAYDIPPRCYRKILGSLGHISDVRRAVTGDISSDGS
jgi:hypothetical protein